MSGAWSDHEVIAYINLVASTMVADGPTLERHSRTRAVRNFGRAVVTQHRRLLLLSDSLLQGRPEIAPPAVSNIALERHSRGMRRLPSAPDLEMTYVSTVKATLLEVQQHLESIPGEHLAPEVQRLLVRARSAIHSELGSAAQLEAAVENLARRRAPAPPPRR